MNDQLTLKDRLRGALYGCAIGDALGLAGEFMTRDEVKMRYPESIRDYDDIFQDAHRSQWAPGEWTNDTEVSVIILESIIENDAFDLHKIASRLKQWYQETPADLPSMYHFIFRDPDYEKDPTRVAHEVWKNMDKEEASNEALPRAVFAGISAERYIERGAEIAHVTHADPRCIGASMAIARMAHDLIWHNEATSPEELIEIVRPIDDRIIPYINWAREDSLSPLNLDDEDTLWYCRKAMATGLWSVWHNLSPMEAFDAILAEGGDVDTNAAVALSLLGLRYGPEGFPQQLREKLLRHDYLEDLADRLHDYFKRHEIHSH